jgi:putative FmdB family regulatory protein
MPIYEYRCAACGHHLEALQKMTEAPLRKCPHCGKSQLRRLMSAPQFRLKGSGWYETDFKNKNETKRNLVEKAGGESGESGGDKFTESTAKEDAGKAVADAKKDGAEPKAAQPKPESTKPSTAKTSTAKSSTAKRRKPAVKSRARTARR